MKIALVGPPAVGKDVVANYIEKKYKLTHISSGNIVRDYVKNNNLGGLDRENLQIVANKLRNEKGGDIIVKIALEKVKDNLIISGLRAIDEVESFKKSGGKIIAITAPAEKRYLFGKKRGRIGDNVSIQDFIKLEEKEQVNADRNSQNVKKVLSMADIEIVNDGNLQNLFEKCDKVLNECLAYKK